MSKLGYTFTGWYLNGVAVDPLTYTFTESATLVAVWEPIKCYVTFYVGESVYQRQTVEYNDFATVPAAPSGYTGWDFDPTVPVTEDMTVYAPHPADWMTPSSSQARSSQDSWSCSEWPH